MLSRLALCRALFASSLCVLSLAGCGSGSTNTPPSIPPTGGGGSQAEAPAISSLSPTSAFAGSGAITLKVAGSNFVSSSTVDVNGTPVPTTYVSATTLMAIVSASYLKTVGTVPVTIVNAAASGGTSSAVNLPVTAVSDPSPQALQVLNDFATDLAWDPVNQQMYLSGAGNFTSLNLPNGTSVQVLNPFTGALGASVAVGPYPNLVAVSATSQYLYASEVGPPEAKVHRYLLPALTPDITISVASDTNLEGYSSYDLQPDPVADGTALVSGPTSGVVVYDDAVARGTRLCDGSTTAPTSCTPTNARLFYSLHWKPDGSEIYGEAYDQAASKTNLYAAGVGASGLSSPTVLGPVSPDLSSGTVGLHFDAPTGYLYDDGGNVLDPVSGKTVGTFTPTPASYPGPGSYPLMVPDGELNTAFFLYQDLSPANKTGSYIIESFNMKTFAPIATLSIPISGNDLFDNQFHFIRWGSDGLAFVTTPDFAPINAGKVYLIRGTFVNPASAIQNPGTPVAH